jgi:exonuclease III
VRLISWNVAGRRGKQAAQAGALLARKPDVVALQEVTMGTVARWRKGLAGAGLTACVDSSECLAERTYFNLLAARYPLEPLPALTIPFPERVLGAVAASPWGPVEIHVAHLPPGVTRGLIKVETFEAIATALRAPPRTAHRILCGDFNTPQSEATDGRVQTWADHHPRWRQRWEAAERSVLTGLGASDLPDVFRQLNGYAPRDVSWVWKGRGREVGRRFDHVFASRSLNAVRCQYVHDWRLAGLSDHSAIEVNFRPWER